MIKKWHAKHLKTIGILLIIIVLFSASLYTFFYGEITNATTFIDFIYFGVTTTTTLGAADMVPTSQRVRLYIALYMFIFLYVLVFSEFVTID
jgi:hypothetical protein